MRRPGRIFAIVLLAMSCVVSVWLLNHDGDLRAQQPSIRTLPTRVPAPSLDGGGQWHNTAGPLSLRQLRGKFVILDFWTYCCINCLQTLPELKKLEQAYPNELVVVGVHTPKFTTEREDANLREAIIRYEVDHPVVNDADQVLWRKYEVAGWPSLRIIDPEGFVVAVHGGEATFEMLNVFMKRAIRAYRGKGVLDATPLHFDLERKKTQPTPLRFPGKVLADEAGGRLFIADSGHHRIVITKLDGTLLDVVGTGAIGRKNGAYDEAQFDHPQGMALDGDQLYVADTENHLIRKIDLKAKRVTTLAGSGELSYVVVTRSTTRPTAISLSSPWALWLHDKDLFIAMAGKHQIWKMTLGTGRIGPYSGNGIEDVIDGPLLPRTKFQKGFASFAQPSGLASDGKWLYVADSEGSSIRAVPFARAQKVLTVIGTSHLPDQRLFAYGDRDGPAGTARLQHPLGVVHHRGRLYVADTYNHKIKVIDLAQLAIRTIAGDGQPGRGDAPARFDEPSGLSIAGGKLYVADTNNHSIRVLDLADGNRISTLAIKELQPPNPPDDEVARELPGTKKITFRPAEVKLVDGKLRIAVQLKLPDGWTLSPDAPMSYSVSLGTNPQPAKQISLEKPAAEFAILQPLPIKGAAANLTVSLTYYYCRKGAEGLCKIGAVQWSGLVKLSDDATTDRLELSHVVR